MQHVKIHYANRERDSRLHQELHQPRMATGGGGVQGRPQLAVARVDAGARVQKTLHHVGEVVDAALQEGGTERGLLTY